MTYFMSLIPSLLAAMILIISQQAVVHAASVIDLGFCSGFSVMGGTSAVSMALHQPLLRAL